MTGAAQGKADQVRRPSGFSPRIRSLRSSEARPPGYLLAILRFIAAVLYRIKVIGLEHVPRDGGALLVSNHVTFADGLFITVACNRPIRFLVYAPYFQHPIMGPFLRAMRAIPLAASSGTRQILHALREAGEVLDAGGLVCVFPEGELTYTGTLQHFQRGIERIVKRRSCPIIPVHLDRAATSIFSATRAHALPERIPLPVTVSFGPPVSPQTSLFQIRQAIRELGRDAWDSRKSDCRPLHHGFIGQWRRHPFRFAFADLQRARISGIQAIAGVVALARALRPLWEGQARVGILLPFSVEGVLVNVAASLSGRTSVNLNFKAGSARVQSAVMQAGIRTIVTSRVFVDRARVELPAIASPIWLEDLAEQSRIASRVAALVLAAVAPVRMLERMAGADRRPSVDDEATIVFTSGSTGEPKGVVLSHFNIESNIEAIAQLFHSRPDDRMLGVLPLFHAFGIMSLWLASRFGIGTVAHPNPLDATTVDELAERFRATILLATPTLLRLYLHRCAPAHLGSLRLVLVGAERLPPSLATAFQDQFGIRPLEGYGVTECAPVISVGTLDYRAPGFFQPGSRRGYAGQPLPGVSVRIVCPETFEELEPGRDGLVLVRGPNVMRGYLGRDDLTAAAFHDAWYITGDIGQMDEEGYLRIVDRVSRFSKIGGEMVSHACVEEALQQAAAADSQVFAVTAVADALGSDRLVVLYTIEEQELDRALEQLALSDLPRLFVPHRDQFIKIETIPMLGTGKPDLQAIRGLAEAASAKRLVGGDSAERR